MFRRIVPPLPFEHAPRWLLLTAIVCLAAAGPVWADKVVKKNGQKLEGSVISESSDFIEMRLSSGMNIRVARTDIAEMTRDAGATAEETDGDSALGQNKFDNALALYQRARETARLPEVIARLDGKIGTAQQRIRERDEAAVRALLQEFEEALKAKRYDKGQEILDRIQATYKGQTVFEDAVRKARARLHYWRAAVALDSVNTPVAERELNTSLELDPNLFESLELSGRLAKGRGQIDLAMTFFQRALESAKSGGVVRDEVEPLEFEVAQLLFELGRFSDALPYFTALREKASSRFPRAIDLEIEALSRLGDDAIATRNDMVAAAQYYEHSLAVGPNHPMVRAIRRKLGELYLIMSPPNPDKALEQLSILRDQQFAVADLFFLIARAHLAKGNVTEAIKALELEISLNPANYNAYIELAKLYVDTGQFGRANDTLNAAIAANEDPYPAYLILGRLRRLQERYDEAEKLLNQVLAKDDTVVEALLLLGQVKLEKQEFDESARLFDEIIAKYEKDGTTSDAEVETLVASYNGRGRVDLEKAQTRLAIDRFDKAKALRADNAESYKNIGDAQRMLQNFKLAEENFLKAVELDPKNPDFLLSLGLLYHNSLEIKEKAIEYYNRYFDLGGQDYNSVNKWLVELGAPARTAPIRPESTEESTGGDATATEATPTPTPTPGG